MADFELAKTKRWRRREVHCSEMRKDGSVDKIGREGRRRGGKEGGRLKVEEEGRKQENKEDGKNEGQTRRIYGGGRKEEEEER